MNTHPIPDAPMTAYEWLAMSACYGAIGALFWTFATGNRWPAIAAAGIACVVLALGYVAREEGL